MNIYLLQLVGKWISFAVISLVSLFSNSFASVKQIIAVKNDNLYKNYNVVNTIIEHDTKILYNEKLPYNITNILVEGIDGIIYQDGEERKIIKEAVTEVIEKGTGSFGEYKGMLTGYGPDCSTCNGKGVVACKTETKRTFNLLTDGIYYNDSEYGTVRILAADLGEFPCGTIIYVDNGRLDPFYGVVLDTGYAMREAYKNGVILMDLAFKTELDKAVHTATNKTGNVSYSVRRWGW